MSNPYYDGTESHGYVRDEPRRRRQGGGGVIFVLLVVIVLSVGGTFGVSMWLSVRSLTENLESAGSYIDRLQSAVSELDAANISWASKNISQDIHDAELEVSGWTWNVAANLPVLGNDVAVARRTIYIGLQLTDEALLPMAERYQELNDGLGGGYNAMSSERIVANAQAVANLARSVSDAGIVIKDCKEAAEGIGTSHINALNQTVVKLRTLLQEADSVYNGLQGWVDAVEAIAGLVS